MTLVGVIATHYHPDHVGGNFIGNHTRRRHRGTAGAQFDVAVHVQADEVEWVTERTGVGPSSLVAHELATSFAWARFDVSLIHTPGHTPGSQCLWWTGD